MMINLKYYEDQTKVKELLSECMWADEERIVKEINAYRIDDSRDLCGKIIDNELVGLIGIGRIIDEIIELKHIAVNARYRNKGIGKNMIQEYFIENKISRMEAETDEDAVNFYRRIGFEVSCLGEKYPGRERFQCVLNRPIISNQHVLGVVSMKFEEIIKGKKYDLGHPLDRETPVWPSHPPFFMTLNNRHGDVPDASNCGYGSANEVIITSGHHSTHIDAFGHVSNHGVLHGDVLATDIQHGKGQQRGLTSHGVETIEPIIRRGVMLDIPLLRGKRHLEAAEPVTADDLKAAAENQQVVVQKGDCVLVRTGWAQFYDDKNAYLAGKGGLPGPEISAAKWLAEKKIFLTGSDTIVYELNSPDRPGLPVHQELIANNGIHLIECLDLEELARDKVYEFLFICIPLKITGATGSPVRPVAIV